MARIVWDRPRYAVETRRHGLLWCSAVAWEPDPAVRLGLRLRPAGSAGAMTRLGARFKLWRMLRRAHAA